MRTVAQAPMSVDRLAVRCPQCGKRGYNRGASNRLGQQAKHVIRFARLLLGAPVYLADQATLEAGRHNRSPGLPSGGRSSRRAGSVPINGGSRRCGIWSTATPWPGSAVRKKKEAELRRLVAVACALGLALAATAGAPASAQAAGTSALAASSASASGQRVRGSVPGGKARIQSTRTRKPFVPAPSLGRPAGRPASRRRPAGSQVVGRTGGGPGHRRSAVRKEHARGAADRLHHEADDRAGHRRGQPPARRGPDGHAKRSRARERPFQPPPGHEDDARHRAASCADVVGKPRGAAARRDVPRRGRRIRRGDERQGAHARDDGLALFGSDRAVTRQSLERERPGPTGQGGVRARRDPRALDQR